MEESVDKKNYELAFLAKSEEAGQTILELLKRAGAEINFESPLSKINLAYEIKGNDSAYFGYFHFSSAPQIIKALDSDLKAATPVLRSLIITPPLVRDDKISRLAPRMRKRAPVFESAPQKKAPLPLSNEALEKELKEILQ